MILGIPDIWISGALIACLVSMLGCAIYGLINWNKGSDL